jgi:transcriptional regulator with XRE-family HTH domain
MTTTLGSYIRTLRDQMDLSLREFAKKLGCSPAFISDVELGRRYPSETMLAEIARILKTTVDDLKKHDIRAPIDVIKRATATNSGYAFAFRRVIESNVSPEDLLKLARKTDKDKGK